MMYKFLQQEVKLYLQGKYGKAPKTPDAKIIQLAIGEEEIIDCRPADLLKPEWANLLEDAGENAHCDEDIMTIAMFPDVGKDFLKHRDENTLEQKH